MNGSEFAEIRRNLGLSEAKFGELLGYTGKPKNNKTRIEEYERGKKQIPLYIARLAWLLGEIQADVEQNAPEMWPACVDDDGKVQFPSWDGYDFDHEADGVQNE